MIFHVAPSSLLLPGNQLPPKGSSLVTVPHGSFVKATLNGQSIVIGWAGSVETAKLLDVSLPTKVSSDLLLLLLLSFQPLSLPGDPLSLQLLFSRGPNTFSSPLIFKEDVSPQTSKSTAWSTRPPRCLLAADGYSRETLLIDTAEATGR